MDALKGETRPKLTAAAAQRVDATAKAEKGSRAVPGRTAEPDGM